MKSINFCFKVNLNKIELRFTEVDSKSNKIKIIGGDWSLVYKNPYYVIIL
jgi:hypothetical protein